MALMMKARKQLGVPGAEAEGATGEPPVQEDQGQRPADSAQLKTLADSIQYDENGKKRNWWQRRRAERELTGSFESYSHLLALKPKEHYLFRSDYIEVDDSVTCVLGYFHDEASHDTFAPFWGIDRIPDGLDDRVTAVVLEQVVRKDDKWIDQYSKQSEKLNSMESSEQESSGTMSSKRKAAKVSGDLEEVIGEIQDGATYLHVHNRLFLKAPDLETLEESIERVTRLYIDRFGTLTAAAYAGEQRQELTGLFRNNDKKRGKGFHYTSTELAGSYSLVTNGLNDRDGEYVGFMVGDVNSSAVLMGVNNYDKHVVVADSALSDYLERERISNMWCSKLSQACMLANGRTVHLVLDGADLNKLGPTFDQLTSRVDLNSGDVNPFEVFGDENDELAVFSTHMEKLKLMFEQLYESSDGAVASIIRSNLETIATDFYVDQGMWLHNAKEQRHRLRVVGIPHEQVPRLQLFVSYIDMAHKRLVSSEKNDPDQLRALNLLHGIAHTMLSTNGDLFNNHTATAIDGVRDSRRVVYDFSRLLRRGKGVAMAQLVNIIGFAVGQLGLGDTVIIHGTERIDKGVQSYITDQFEHLFERGGRVVYGYNDVDKMLADSDFNHFDSADYTVFGSMKEKTVAEYQKQLHLQIPPDLAQLITMRGEGLSYLRRDRTNVVFHLDLALGINPHREAQRRKVALEAARITEKKKMASIFEEEPVVGAHITSIRNNDSDESIRQSTDGATRQRKVLPGAKGRPEAAQKATAAGQSQPKRKLAKR